MWAGGVKLKGKESIIIIVLLIAILTACGKKDNASSDLGEKDKNKSSNISIEIPPMTTNGVVYGVVMRKNKNRIILQSDLGTTVKFEIDKKTDTEEIGDDLKEGIAVKVLYEGKLTNSFKLATQISTSEKQPLLNREALVTAGQIILSVKDRELRAFSKLCDYPLIIDKGKDSRIKNPNDLTAHKKKDIFTKKLVTSILSTDLFNTNEYKNGFLLGRSKPNIVIQKKGKTYKIMGIHYK